MNSEMDASLNDEGCEWWDNLCVLNDGTEPALGGDGDKCVRPTCVNTVSSIFGVDHDCSPWYNRCVSDVGIDPGDDPLQLGVAGTQCIHSTPSGPGGALDVVSTRVCLQMGVHRG